MGRKSLELIEKMTAIAKASKPITGRGVGYKLFTAGLISSMDEMQRVYRLLKEARERGMIDWDWIVDEAREFERAPSWNNPEQFARAASRQYRRDFWRQQRVRCEVWSEKGTLRGVLAPVLDEHGVGFRVMHGFGSATVVHNIADDHDRRRLIALYVGDWDPSGLCMSERDLPDRLLKYDGYHVDVSRIALVQNQLHGLPSFPAADKPLAQAHLNGDGAAKFVPPGNLAPRWSVPRLTEITGTAEANRIRTEFTKRPESFRVVLEGHAIG
jgi:hypothetical protein